MATAPQGGIPELRATLLGDHASDDASNPQPLPVLFSRCHSVHQQQDAVVATRDDELLSAALALFQLAEAAVDRAGLFSANEDVDDLSTADMKYLLLPYYRARLLLSLPATVGVGGTSGPQGRLDVVYAAQRAFGAFLVR